MDDLAKIVAFFFLLTLLSGPVALFFTYQRAYLPGAVLGVQACFIGGQWLATDVEWPMRGLGYIALLCGTYSVAQWFLERDK